MEGAQPFERPDPARVPDWVFVVLSVAAGGWCLIVLGVAHAVGWLVEQVLETPYPPAGWPLLTGATAAAMAVPVLPLAIWVRRARIRAVAHTWAYAAASLAVLAVAKAVPLPRSEWTSALLAVLSLGAALGHWRSTRGLPVAAGWVPALVSGLVLALPWAWAGSLGAPYEVALNVLAAAAIGVLGGLLLAGRLWPAFAGSPRWQVVLGAGPAAAVAAAALGAGAGPPGAHLLLMVTLPAAALAATVLAATGRRGWVAAAVLLGLGAVGPLALVDPEELTLLLGFADVGACAALAAAAAGVLGLLVSGALWVGAAVAPRLPRPRPVAVRALSGATALVLVAAGAIVSVAAGQAGFHGEHLFVVLSEQAAISPAPDGESLTARRERVYRELVAHAERTQADLRADLTAKGVEFTPYYLVNGVEVADSPALRRWLARRDDVAEVVDAPRLRPVPLPAEPEHGSADKGASWGISAIDAQDVRGVDGTGIVVGIADSGVDGDHPALRDNYRGFRGRADYNWYDPWNHTVMPVDTQGHGTHTAGTATGRGGIGVAPGAQWIGCVNLARNFGSAVRYLDCLQFMLAPFPAGGDPLRDGRPSLAADVLNNSWGCPELEGCSPGVLRPAARALHAAGIFVVASAGNSGPDCGSVTDPLALYPDAFTVGASDVRGEVADFSSRGPVTADGSGRSKPDLLAPGVEILSALPGGTYGRLSGTSMAGPHVVGVVALMWQASPALRGDVDRTAALLRATAKPAADPPRVCGGSARNVVGAGVVNALAAVTAAKAVR